MYALLYIYMLKLHLVFLVDVFTLAPVVCLCLLSRFNDVRYPRQCTISSESATEMVDWANLHT